MYSGNLRKQQNNQQNFLYTHIYQQEWIGPGTIVRETQVKGSHGSFLGPELGEVQRDSGQSGEAGKKEEGMW